MSFEERVQRFVEDATVGRLDRARRWFERDPAIATSGLAPALLLGDVDRVTAELRRDPDLARRAAGPREWEPLLHVCHSCFLGRDPDRTPGLVATAALLLQAGADPNATAPSPNWPGSVWTPLYGAAGVAHDPRRRSCCCGVRAHLDRDPGLVGSLGPSELELLPEVATWNDDAPLRVVLADGFPVDARGELQGTALHHAAWWGQSR